VHSPLMNVIGEHSRGRLGKTKTEKGEKIESFGEVLTGVLGAYEEGGKF